MSDTYRVRPISAWDRPTTKYPSRSPFRTAWGTTLALLWKELNQLGASDVVLEIDIREQDLKINGEMRASARPASDRLALSFKTPDGPLRFCCDQFDKWQDNLRAIALGLESLRRVDRYGITNKGEQYAGWRAIGSGRATEAMDRDTAIKVLQDLSGFDEPLNDLPNAHKRALFAAHPDHGGSTEAFVALTQAMEVLS